MSIRLGMFTDGRFYWDGGTRYFTQSNWRKVLLSEYARLFDEIRVFCRCSVMDFDKVEPTEIIQLPNVSFTRLPQFRGFKGYLFHRQEIFSLIRKGLSDCDICLMRVPSQVSSAGLKMAKALGKKVVCHIVGDFQAVLSTDETLLKTKMLRYLASRLAYQRQRREVNQCQRQVAISSMLAKKYCEHPEVVRIVPNTTLVDEWFMPYRRRAPGEPLNALFVGRLEHHKNIQLFLQALARVRVEGVQVRTTIVGDGNYAGVLRQLADKLHIADAVHFTGRVNSREKLREYYRQAHLLYLLSFTEGLGIVLLEAGAISLPIIGSRRGGIPEIAREDQNAFLVEPDDVDGCVAALKQFDADESLRERMGKESQKIVRPFTVNRVVHSLAEVVNELI